jgi:hypothetical protein
MGMLMRVSGTDEDFGKFMSAIVVDCDVAAVGAVSDIAEVTKKAVVRRLSAARYSPIKKDGTQGSRPREIHMADDVIIKKTRDKYGYPVVRVQGGKKTGTLWHILNDGNYGKEGNHFMDNAIADAESQIDSIVDMAMRKAGF